MPRGREYLPKQGLSQVQQSATREVLPIRDVTALRLLRKHEFGVYGGKLYRGIGNGQTELVGGDPAVVQKHYTVASTAANDALALAQAHHARHENGGADEVDVTGLSGLLGDAQTPLAHPLVDAYHTASGLTVGHVPTATGATTFAWQAPSPAQLYRAHKTFWDAAMGTLTTGSATPTTLDLIRKNAGCNKGCVVETPAFAELATHIQQDSNPNFYIIARTSGGNVVWQQDSAGVGFTPGDSTPDMKLDGVSQGAWNQPVNGTFTMTAVAAGVHKFEMDGIGAASEFDCFYKLTLPQYPYQGLAVADDEFVITHPLGFALVHSAGTGRTSNATNGILDAMPGGFGEGLDRRLPMGTAATLQSLGRSDILLAGETAHDHAVNNLRCFQLNQGFYRTGTADRGPWRAGLYMKAGAAATVGRQVATPSVAGAAFGEVGTELSASIIVLAAVPCLARCTTKGSGGNFEVGDECLLIVTTCTGAAGNEVHTWGYGPHSFVGADVFGLVAAV